jgi:hypothetical protein
MRPRWPRRPPASRWAGPAPTSHWTPPTPSSCATISPLPRHHHVQDNDPDERQDADAHQRFLSRDVGSGSLGIAWHDKPLATPVTALLAGPSGGYRIAVVDDTGRRLVFDDAAGTV